MGEPVIGTLQILEGWEHGVLSTAGGFLCDSIVANAGASVTIDSSQAASGTYSLKFTQTNAANQGCNIQYGNIISNGFFAGSFKFRKSANPTSRTKFWDCYFSGLSVYVELWLETDGSLTLSFNSGSTQTAVIGALSSNAWHSIEIGFDTTGTTWLGFLKVNGTDSANTATATQSNGEFAGFMTFGANTGIFTGANGTYNIWWDDIVFSDDVADYPPGPFTVKGYSVNGVGTHSLDATPSAHFFKHDNTTETALTTSETTSHQMIDEIPFGTSVADRIQVKAVVGTPSLPTFVSAGTVSSGAAGVTPGVPASTAADDILIITVESENETAATLSGGNQTWTEIGGAGGAGVGTGSAVDATRIQAFWARRGATTPTMPSTSDTGDHQQVRCTAWRGCYTQGDPIGGSQTSTESGNTDASGSATGFTTLTANEMVLIAIGTALPDTADTGAEFSSPANANLGSVTERTDNTTNAGTGGGMGLISGTKATAGAIGATTFTTAQSTAKAMLVFSLKGAVAITQPNNTKYAEYTLADSAEATAPILVSAMVAVNNAGPGTSELGVKLYDGTTAGQVIQTTFSTAGTILFLGAKYTLTPTGLTWTDALFDGLTIRVGYTANAVDTPRLENVIVQAAFVTSGSTTYQKTGSSISGSVTAGADATQSSELGSVVPASKTSGADAATIGRAGSVITQSRVSGVHPYTYLKLGSALASALMSGVDAAVLSELGSLSPASKLSGVDAPIYSELGSLTPKGIASGADASTMGRAGSLTPLALESGADASAFSELGSLIPSARVSGADAAVLSELGSLISMGLVSGADAYTSAELGSLISQTLMAGVASKSSSGKSGALIAGALLAGIDVAQRSESGSLVGGTLLAGVDIAEHVELGSLLATALLAGADASTRSELGSLIASALVSGADASTRAELGSLLSGALTSGADAATSTETGSVTPISKMSGVDAYQAVESGSLRAQPSLSGSRVYERVRTAYVAAQTLLAGADAAILNKLGSLIAKSLVSGVSVKLGAGKTGSLAPGSKMSGVKAIEFNETSFLAAKTFGAGIDAYTATRTGLLLSGTNFYGADVHIASRTGALLGLSSISALKVTEFNKAGSLITQALLSGLFEISTGYQITGEEAHFLLGAAIDGGTLLGVGEGQEIHLLLGAVVEDGKLISAGPEDIVILAVTPGTSKLNRGEF